MEKQKVSETDDKDNESLFDAQLEAMGKVGLDVHRFSQWLDEEAECITWPSGALSNFFRDAEEPILMDSPEADAQYFEKLGVSAEVASYFAEMYPDMEMVGLMPADLLTEFYESRAAEVQSAWIRKQMEGHELPPSMTVSERNLQKLLNPLSDNVGIYLDVPGPKKSWDEDPIFETKQFTRFSELPVGADYLFHSTLLANALSIIISGPFTGFPSKYPGDFDTAFYLNSSNEAALLWAERAARRRHADVAIFVFKVPDDVRSQWKELKLGNDENWKKLVKAFRRQDYSKVDLECLFRDFDVISGPVASNPRQLIRGNEEPVALNDYEQIAIQSRSLAASLRHHCVGALIIKHNGL